MGASRSEDADGAMAACIAACNEGNRVCLQHIEHCLNLGGAHADPAHISMLLACASVCRTATELMSLDSEWYPTLCDVCAQVCDECADECEELGDMEDCVAACQNCADACREMVGEQFDEDEEADEEELAADERIN
ncbi:MAG TPA: four-helix bundle copper-binding protein [Burkholderiaceae bacterium]|nr:four-helix bundle copper-binding protein [Burkholderiaceae bacterium]